jgi:hypothetical protein
MDEIKIDYLNDPKIEIQTQYNLADLAKPQATEILKARIARHEAMSDEESEVKAAAWERFKQNIDADRPNGSKLYS